MRTSRAQFLKTLEKIRKIPWTLVWPDGRTKKVTIGPGKIKDHIEDFRVVHAGDKHPWFPKLGKCKVPTICWVPGFRRAKSAYARTALFTLTSKLRAASFGLSAGPPALGGTCPASNDPMATPGYVCHNCYATGGNYRQPNMVLYGSLRACWVEENIGSLSEQIVSMLRELHQETRYDSNGWPASPDFFRIHDTGDIDFLPGYYEEWIKVARAMPDVMFWMPTRAWHTEYPGLKKSRPSNLIVRPSPLYLDSDGPTIDYLDAPSTCCFNDTWEQHADHDCPAVFNHSNCEDQDCRRCWIESSTVVNYRPHGEARKGIRKHMARRNPGEDLEGLYKQYMSSGKSGKAARRNPPPAHFAEWMAQSGRALSDWSLEEWEGFLTGQGLDDDEAGEWIAETAEYD